MQFESLSKAPEVAAVVVLVLLGSNESNSFAPVALQHLVWRCRLVATRVHSFDVDESDLSRTGDTCGVGPTQESVERFSNIFYTMRAHTADSIFYLMLH